MLASTYFAGFNMTKEIWGYVEMSGRLRYRAGLPILPQGECPVSYVWLPEALTYLGPSLPSVITGSTPWSALLGASAALCGFYTELLCAVCVTAGRNPVGTIWTVGLLVLSILAFKWSRAQVAPLHTARGGQAPQQATPDRKPSQRARKHARARQPPPPAWRLRLAVFFSRTILSGNAQITTCANLWAGGNGDFGSATAWTQPSGGCTAQETAISTANSLVTLTTREYLHMLTLVSVSGRNTRLQLSGPSARICWKSSIDSSMSPPMS